MKQDFAVFVNTTDSFEDCWLPFFKLFARFWPDYNGTIYLNTEKKDFKYPGLHIVPIKNQKSSETWSTCLLSALDFIPDQRILYLQEDYFFRSAVKAEKISDFYSLFKQMDFDCLHLTDQSTGGPFRKTEKSEIWEILKGADYRLSTQAAFWKKESLKNLIRVWENAWQFEHFGSMRSDLMTDKIMTLSHDYLRKEGEIIPYLFTGIIKGQWKQEVEPLFTENHISLDFAIRGFTNPKSKRGLKSPAKYASRWIVNLKSRLDLFSIKG